MDGWRRTAAVYLAGIATAAFLWFGVPYLSTMETVGGSEWMPRWHCSRRDVFSLVLYFLGNVLMAASYMAIPVTLYRLRNESWLPSQVKRGKRLFMVFIAACGVTHAMGLVMLWVPAYRWEALLMLAAGLVSAYTAVWLRPAVARMVGAVRELEAQRDAAVEHTDALEGRLDKAMGVLVRLEGLLEGLDELPDGYERPPGTPDAGHG